MGQTEFYIEGGVCCSVRAASVVGIYGKPYNMAISTSLMLLVLIFCSYVKDTVGQSGEV